MTTANNTQNIPFNEAQQAWLGGFFAGMHSHILQSAGSGDAANARTITILYGSQTGNSESVANDAAQAAKAHGLNAKVLGMDEIERDAFIGLEYLLIITSTYGEGDMPDNAQMLWEAISSDDSISLANMKYSVLALGDTSYDLFCQAGIDWDQCLAKLGATCLANGFPKHLGIIRHIAFAISTGNNE
jgi:sulfite reductase (NADPH) flavoprotein alpha-component